MDWEFPNRRCLNRNAGNASEAGVFWSFSFSAIATDVVGLFWISIPLRSMLICN